MAEKTQTEPRWTNAIRWAVFLITVSLVIITLISVVFPALIVRTFSPIDSSPVNPWETGPLAFSLIATNLILLGIGTAYYENKLPKIFTNMIKYLFNFEVSKKISFIVLLIILCIYIISSINETTEIEKGIDTIHVIAQAQDWNIDDFTPNFYILRFFLLSSSINLFDNIRIIPFIASIALVILTYFLTLELSHKRFGGLIAVVILLQSFTFLKYDSTSTYENFWTVFYIFSLYLIYKIWQLSPFSFVLSVLSKPLTILFLPMTLFFIYRADISSKKKILLTLSFFTLIVVGLVIVTLTDITPIHSITYSEFYFWQGFTSVAHSLRFDYLVILFLLPLTLGLFLASRRGIIQSDSILILIAGILFSAPLLTGFTDLTNQPYRFIPLIVFFSIGVGVLFSKTGKKIIKYT